MDLQSPQPVTRDWVWRQTGGREGQVSSGNPKVHTACAARRHGGAASRCHGCRGVPLGPGVPPRSAQQSRQRGGEGTGGITHQRIVSPGATSYSLLESSTACLRYRLVGRRLDGEHLINGESREHVRARKTASVLGREPVDQRCTATWAPATHTNGRNDC